jgi:hypothetical protein
MSCAEQYSMIVQTLMAKYNGVVLDDEVVDNICKDYKTLMTIYNEDCFFGCLPIEEMEMFPNHLAFNERVKWYIKNFTFKVNVKNELKNEEEFIKYLESVKETADIKKRIFKLWT